MCSSDLRILVGGLRELSIRVWIDPVKLAANDLTIQEVERALRGENIRLPAGTLEADNIGNNHLCIHMPSIEKVDLNSIYQELYKTIKDLDINLSIFTKSKGDIHIRTYENGTGETLSCGSAALCIAAKSLTKNKVKVISMGGELSFKANKNGILMTGPSNFIYQGATNE